VALPPSLSQARRWLLGCSPDTLRGQIRASCTSGAASHRERTDVKTIALLRSLVYRYIKASACLVQSFHHSAFMCVQRCFQNSRPTSYTQLAYHNTATSLVLLISLFLSRSILHWSLLVETKINSSSISGTPLCRISDGCARYRDCRERCTKYA
jgi:hypothetical protein